MMISGRALVMCANARPPVALRSAGALWCDTMKKPTVKSLNCQTTSKFKKLTLEQTKQVGGGALNAYLKM